MIGKLSYIVTSLKRLLRLSYDVESLKAQIQELRESQCQLLELNGRIASMSLHNSAEIKEYQVYSQAGDDGIIQSLIKALEIQDEQKTFIEFGVQSYWESNTHFLLVNDNWSGFVMDGDAEAMDNLKKSVLCQKYNLTCKQAFITRDNINQLIAESGFNKNVGILSIDIDGNDYWIWEEISIIDPLIVIIEYNHRLGPSRSCTIPYQADFVRTNAHYSNIYYGASLTALVKLGKRKGYKLVTCNSFGNNAYFVKDCLQATVLPEKSVEEAYRSGKFSELRDRDGQLINRSKRKEEEILSNLPICEIE